MTQPPHWQTPEDGPQQSFQYGQQPRYGQPQYQRPQYQRPQYEQPQYQQPQYAPPQYGRSDAYGQQQAYGPPPFYGPGPYPPPHPAKRTNRTVILSIIGVLVIVGGAAVAILLLTGGNGDKKHTAGPGGSPVNGTPAPGEPTAFPRTNPPQGPSAASVSCPRIKSALIGSGAFKAGSITVSDGGTPPSAGVPLPDGAPTTTCTVRPSNPQNAGGVDHVTVIAWRGVSERTFDAQLKNAGYDASSEGDYTFWVHTGSSQAQVVTATIGKELVTFYVA